MSKNLQDNDFDPSNNEEFQKTIDSLFLDEKCEEDVSIEVEDSKLIEITESSKNVEIIPEDSFVTAHIDTVGSEKIQDSIQYDVIEDDSDFFKIDPNELDMAIAASLDEVYYEIEKEHKTVQITDETIEINETVEEPEFEFITLTNDLKDDSQTVDSTSIMQTEETTIESGVVDETTNETEIASDRAEKSQEEVVDEQTVAANDEELLEYINASLAQQVNFELDQDKEKKEFKKRKLPKWLMILLIVLGSMSLFGIVLFGTPLGTKLVSKIVGAIITGGMNEDQSSDLTPSLTITPNPNDVALGEIVGDLNLPSDHLNSTNARAEDYIVNILLLGEESIDSEGANGRTDLMIIASIDTRTKKIKLTSLMRDMLVAIPGYDDNRLNAVYSKGGIDLLYETIEQNFDVYINGYMLVGFESFEQVVDALGGVIIEINEEEKDWLNSTNYISNPEYRTLITGFNKMNGNQALGYCRIRQVATSDNKYSDFGRTSRQRILLNALFDKVKSKNMVELVVMMNQCLPLVTTNITSSEMSTYIEMVLTNKITSIEQFQVPQAGTFSDIEYNGIGDLISVNFPDNIKLLHEFIFGDYKE